MAVLSSGLETYWSSWVINLLAYEFNTRWLLLESYLGISWCASFAATSVQPVMSRWTKPCDLPLDQLPRRRIVNLLGTNRFQSLCACAWRLLLEASISSLNRACCWKRHLKRFFTLYTRRARRIEAYKDGCLQAFELLGCVSGRLPRQSSAIIVVRN